LVKAKSRSQLCHRSSLNSGLLLRGPLQTTVWGLTPEQTKVEVEKILSTFQLFPETPAIFDEWRGLVVSHAVSGLETHDARIVAAMLTHGIAQILTFNEEDFRRYKEITVLTPQSILSARSATS
jgi:predicted nucleic acid-binding protein